MTNSKHRHDQHQHDEEGELLRHAQDDTAATTAGDTDVTAPDDDERERDRRKDDPDPVPDPERDRDPDDDIDEPDPSPEPIDDDEDRAPVEDPGPDPVPLEDPDDNEDEPVRTDDPEGNPSTPLRSARHDTASREDETDAPSGVLDASQEDAEDATITDDSQTVAPGETESSVDPAPEPEDPDASEPDAPDEAGAEDVPGPKHGVKSVIPGTVSTTPEMAGILRVLTAARPPDTEKKTEPAGPPEIEITDARFGDLWALRRIQRECFGADQAYGMTVLAGLMAWPRSAVMVARIGDEIVGCVAGDYMNREGRVLNICVAPNARRQGIAMALLDAIEHRLRRNSMTLMVEDKNYSAQSLYRQQGYLLVGETRDYYGHNRHGYLMQKRRIPPPVGYQPSLLSYGRDKDRDERR